MEARKTPNEELILSYFQQIKMVSYKSMDEFWDNLYKKYPKDMIDNLKDIVSERASDTCNSDSLYILKNQNLKLSLDFSSYSTELYISFFKWFAKAYSLKPKTILDIGCDNGIATCFMAKIFPDAEVIGIDINKSAISCSNELKKLLNVSNVHFKVMDINNLQEQFKSDSFDLIYSLRTMHEIIEIPDILCWSATDQMLSTLEKSPLLCSISSLLKSNGKFISFERLPDTPSLYWWIQLLSICNLYTDLSSSCKIHFHEAGMQQVIPAVVAGKTPGKLPDSIELLAFATSNKSIDFKTENEYIDDGAELAFYLCEPKILLFGFQTNYKNASWSQRHEVWRFKEFLLEYTHNNIGERELVVFPLTKLSDLELKLLRLEDFQRDLGHEMIHYVSTEGRFTKI